jgi:hypothetical protein
MSGSHDDGPEDANHVVVRVYCLGQMKKLRVPLDATAEQIVTLACDRFHLDTRITPAAELEIYVPLPKSTWLAKGSTLRAEKIASTDTLMIQTRGATEGPQLMAQIAALDAQFVQYHVRFRRRPRATLRHRSITSDRFFFCFFFLSV